MAALSAQALSLAQYAIMSNDPLVEAITMSLIDNGAVLADLPLINKQQMISNGVRWEGSLPTVNWRQVNAGTTVTSGTPKPYQEQAYIISNAIDTDRVLVLDNTQIGDPRAQILDAYLQGVAYDINNKFINNAPDTGDPNAIVGLKYRLANNNQYGVRPENLINGGGVDATQTASTQATANKLLEYLDQLLWSVGAPDGTGVTIYVNDVMKRRLAYLARLLGTNGGFSIVKDQIGRQVAAYNNALIRDIGYLADQSTRIIPIVESAAGASTGGTFTSIYACRYAMNGLMGWQFEPLRGQDLGLIGNDGTGFRTLVDYIWGIWPTTNRCFARLYNVKIS